LEGRVNDINQSINQSIHQLINRITLLFHHKVTKKLFEEKELLNSVRGGVEA